MDNKKWLLSFEKPTLAPQLFPLANRQDSNPESLGLIVELDIPEEYVRRMMEVVRRDEPFMEALGQPLIIGPHGEPDKRESLGILPEDGVASVIRTEAEQRIQEKILPAYFKKMGVSFHCLGAQGSSTGSWHYQCEIKPPHAEHFAALFAQEGMPIYHSPSEFEIVRLILSGSQEGPAPIVADPATINLMADNPHLPQHYGLWLIEMNKYVGTAIEQEMAKTTPIDLPKQPLRG